jgi:hypothetical protein
MLITIIMITVNPSSGIAAGKVGGIEGASEFTARSSPSVISGFILVWGLGSWPGI